MRVRHSRAREKTLISATVRAPTEPFGVMNPPPKRSRTPVFLQTASRWPPLLLHEPESNGCAARFCPSLPPRTRCGRTTAANLDCSRVFLESSGGLPCRRFPARRLPVFVPEEGAPRWLPPTPSSYCSGLLERGRIRRSLTIALLKANGAADAHWKVKKGRGFQTNCGRRVGAWIGTTGLRREKPQSVRGLRGEAGTNVGVDRPTRKIQMRSRGALPTGQEARQSSDGQEH